MKRKENKEGKEARSDSTMATLRDFVLVSKKKKHEVVWVIKI